MSDDLLVATKTFITDHDGQRITVVKGKTRVRAGHPIVKGREHMFKAADAQYDVEDTTARPGRKRRARRTKTAAEPGDATTGDQAATDGAAADGAAEPAGDQAADGTTGDQAAADGAAEPAGEDGTTGDPAADKSGD